MGRAPPLVGPQNDRDLRDARPDLRGFDDHLEREFHPRTSQVQAVVQTAGESPHPAVAVPDMNVKKCIEQSSETGIAEVFVERRHGARFDFAPEPVAHHHVVAFAQFFHESRHIAEVVAVVRVPHNDERAARAGDARAQRSAVAALRHTNHLRSVLFRDSNRIVRRAIVRDDYFPG